MRVPNRYGLQLTKTIMNLKELLTELQDMKYWIEKDGMIATLDEAIARTRKAIERLESGATEEEEHYDDSEEVAKEEQELADWEDDSEDY